MTRAVKRLNRYQDAIEDWNKLVEIRQGDHDVDLFSIRDGVLIVVTDTMKLGKEKVVGGGPDAGCPGFHARRGE